MVTEGRGGKGTAKNRRTRGVVGFRFNGNCFFIGREMSLKLWPHSECSALSTGCPGAEGIR